METINIHADGDSVAPWNKIKNKIFPRPLECIYCNKEFDLDEVFIVYINKKDIIVISQCLDCAEFYPQNNPEKEGGWLVLKRILDGYECAE